MGLPSLIQNMGYWIWSRSILESGLPTRRLGRAQANRSHTRLGILSAAAGFVKVSVTGVWQNRDSYRLFAVVRL